MPLIFYDDAAYAICCCFMLPLFMHAAAATLRYARHAAARRHADAMMRGLMLLMLRSARSYAAARVKMRMARAR